MSNTEFVMVPRAELVRLQENMDPHRGAVAWGIVCDLLAKPEEQLQSEPVVLPMRRSWSGIAGWKDQAEIKSWNACLDEVAKLGPLYTQADPGEVERLRAEVKRLEFAVHRTTIDAVSAKSKLAGLDTLLRKCREWIKAARDGVLYPIARDFEGVVGRNAEGLGQETPELLDTIDAALSASAEPSSPQFHACQKCIDAYSCSLDGCQFEPDPKTAEPSAPVEIDERAEFEHVLRDAERYRWLRDNADASWEGWFVKARRDGTGATEADQEVDEWIARAALERKP